MRVVLGTDASPEPNWLSPVLAAVEADESMSAQGRRRLAQIVSRFAMYLSSGHGVRHLADVTSEQARGFVGAPSSKEVGPAAATMHLRRSAIRLTFRIARELALASGDPTIDLSLPQRYAPEFRPLTDAENVLCRSASLSSLTETRLPALWALAEATARTSEIPAVRIRDVDLERRRVFLHDGSKVEPRWSELTDWGALQLARRVHPLASSRGLDALIVYAGDGSPESRQASAATAIRTILVRAGLGAEPGLRPASVAAWAGARLLAQGHPIEEVARRLGMRSLDACARLIGYDWKGCR